MTNHRTERAMGAAARGFSLLEITLVLVIIGLLMGVAAVNLLGGTERARKRTTEATMNTYKTQIQAYMVDHAGSPPATLQALVDGKYVDADNTGAPPRDAWKEPFWYNPAPDDRGHPFQLRSGGKDKEVGTADDLDLWMIGVGEE